MNRLPWPKLARELASLVGVEELFHGFDVPVFELVHENLQGFLTVPAGHGLACEIALLDFLILQMQ